MPEHTPDPIDRLQSLRNGGLAVSPLPPEEVRRLGTRRRTRRHVRIAVASAAVVIAAVVPVALLSHDDGKAGTAPIATITPDPTPTTKVVVFPEDGIAIADPADVERLVGTSPEFRAFIADQVRSLLSETDSCPDGPASVITVQKYSSDGYAIGGVHSCGGYAALWAKRDAGWQEVDGGQEVFDCDELRYLGIPKSFAGGCYDYKGDFGPSEVNGLRIGMTEQQIKTAQGTVDAADGPGCRGVIYRDEKRVADQIDGYLSPTKDLAALFARPGMFTPTGIGLGSSMADVRAAYPTLHQAQRQTERIWVVPVDENSEYQFWFTADDTVSSLTLTRPDQDCFMSH